MGEINMAEVELILAKQKLRESCLRIAAKEYERQSPGYSDPKELVAYAEILSQYCEGTQTWVRAKDKEIMDKLSTASQKATENFGQLSALVKRLTDKNSD